MRKQIVNICQEKLIERLGAVQIKDRTRNKASETPALGAHTPHGEGSTRMPQTVVTTRCPRRCVETTVEKYRSPSESPATSLRVQHSVFLSVFRARDKFQC